MGKYIYGFIINQAGLSPWQLKQDDSFYQQFSSFTLDTDQIESDEKFSGMFKSIHLLKSLGAVVSLISILFFGLIVSLFSKSKITGVLSSVFLFFNPVLHHLYRQAVPNNIQILFVIAAVSLILYLINKIDDLNLMRCLLWALLGIFIAAATSIKLNGLFILIAPIFMWLVEAMKASFLDQELQINILNKFKALAIMLSSFAMIFYWLEPELWRHPIRGLSLLLGSRIDQHQRFLFSYENYSFFETFFFLIVQFLKISNFLVIKLTLIVFLFLGIKKIINKLNNQLWLNVGLLMIFMLISNIFYANVGFERYAEWSIFIFSFLSAVGGIEFLKIIYQKIHCL